MVAWLDFLRLRLEWTRCRATRELAIDANRRVHRCYRIIIPGRLYQCDHPHNGLPPLSRGPHTHDATAFRFHGHNGGHCGRLGFWSPRGPILATSKTAPRSCGAIECSPNSEIRPAVYQENFRSISAIERDRVAIKSAAGITGLAGKLDARAGSHRPGKLQIRDGPGCISG